MSEYTPTTEQLRDEYRFSMRRPDICGKDFGVEFDRWLTEHDRQIAEKAWESAFDWMNHYDDPGPNPYREERYCPTCSGSSRETVGLVCQTCGRDWGQR